MNPFLFIYRSLFHYRRPYLAVLAGVMVSTAVITGALILGDSVRHSLLQITVNRLGKVQFAIPPGQALFRQQLAAELSEEPPTEAAAVLVTGGVVSNPARNLRINSVTITGIDGGFRKMWTDPVPLPGEDEAVVSANVAQRLGVVPGDEIVLRAFKTEQVSTNAPFVAERQPAVAFRLKVKSVADDRSMGRFSLKSNQVAPFNVFVSLHQLSVQLGVKGLANCLLVAGNQGDEPPASNLDSLLAAVWKPEDAGMKIREVRPGLSEITSGRIFFNETYTEAVSRSVPGAEPVLTYLVNKISLGNRSVPYSFVSAVSPAFLAHELKPGETMINTWLAEELGAKPGDRLTLKYFRMGKTRFLKEEERSFTVTAILPMNHPAEDPSLMPQFPGISDAVNCRDWETGAPVDLKQVRPADEQYWRDYRGTPKAFIALAEGQKIWDNPFGWVTCFRFPAGGGEPVPLSTGIMKRLKPADAGLVFRSVFSEGLKAAGNSTDLGSLFLSLSFFLIAAALLLTGLLFSLHARSRRAESGILSATGLRKKQVLWLLSAEALMVVFPGALLGLVAGIGYTRLLLFGLNTLWQEAVGSASISLTLVPETLVAGFLSGSVISMVVFGSILYINLRKPLSELVREEILPAFRIRRIRKILLLVSAVVLFMLSLAMLIRLVVTHGSSDAEAFLSAAGGLMLSFILFFWYLLSGERNPAPAPLTGYRSLVWLNMVAGKGRSLAVFTLMALGTFSLVITGANRKTFTGTEHDRSSGTGGFLFWTESSFPVSENLNSTQGRDHYALDEVKDLSDIHFFQMHQLDGEDASCLNLNQVSKPVILSVDPAVFDRRGSFTFTASDPQTDPGHPWLALNRQESPRVIPAFADMTVITWGLRMKIGDTLRYLDEAGSPLNIVLKGGLDNSIFQGSLLVSDSLFRSYFPSAPRSRFMLVDGPFEKRTEIASSLEDVFRREGLMALPAHERLAAFNAVENTYLSIFLLLGALGILLGTIGLAIVLLRNLIERRREVALCLSLGFTRKQLMGMIVSEYATLLVCGMLAGIIPALAGILPSMISPSFSAMGGTLAVILGLILLNGLFWIWLFARNSVNQQLSRLLKDE